MVFLETGHVGRHHMTTIDIYDIPTGASTTVVSDL